MPHSRLAHSCRRRPERAFLQGGWVIANHILVSFHVAFISSVLALPPGSVLRTDVLRFIFVSPETLVSAFFMYLSFHAGIAIHELGHFLTAARLTALNEKAQRHAESYLRGGLRERIFFVARMLALIPYGKACGIKREGLNYYPDAPYNLAVSAAGPRLSRITALVVLPPALILLVIGLMTGFYPALYAGRPLLGLGVIALLDSLLADPGKLREFRTRERRAREKAARVEGREKAGWWDGVRDACLNLKRERMQSFTHPRLGRVRAPWQFRNCGMGGRHTEKEYPESNISMQEAMFLILSARDYLDAQEMTVRLQGRLKEIIESEEGCRVMGIGLEGGLAPYIEKGAYPLPEVRLWALMKRAIIECGLRPGVDVAIALDPALSELEIAYRKEFKIPDSVGMYLFWRDKSQTVLDRDGILDLYISAVRDHDIPVLSIEDGFSEDDHEGWKKLLDALGDRMLVIGDDLVTTNDRTIEMAVDKKLINTALIKANQIGTLYETILAMLVALGKGLELVVSHRSKSPNDDMEAHIALAANTLGLKAGGGANTERLVKYHAVAEQMQRGQHAEDRAPQQSQHAIVQSVHAYEEPTNAGVPTVGALVEFALPGTGVRLRFRGATPLGTSAGSGEAIHLVDSVIEQAEHREIINRHAELFEEAEPGVMRFRRDVQETTVHDLRDDALSDLFVRAHRYGGKGCLTASENVVEFIAPAFKGRDVSRLTLLDLDATLLSIEISLAHRRGKLPEDAPLARRIEVMQRKQNVGMNAMLSMSLAVARGLAHMRGMELFELLREEMYRLIERLAETQGIKVEGSRFEDYVAALKAVNERLSTTGNSLYEALREVSGLYHGVPSGSPPAPAGPRQPPEEARKVLDDLARSLGPDFEQNPHHGRRHAEDLLERAASLAGRLGVADKLDWPVLAAAITLHDAGAEKADHGEESARLARRILTQKGTLAAERIELAADAIRWHEDRTAKGAGRRDALGLEAQILYDIDQLEAFGVKGAYRYIAVYTARGNPLGDIPTNARARLESLAFDESRELAAADYRQTCELFSGLVEAKPTGSTPTPIGPAGVVSWIAAHQALTPHRIASQALEALASIDPASPAEGVAFARRFFTTLREAYPDGTGSATDSAIAAQVGPSQTAPSDLPAEIATEIASVSRVLSRGIQPEASATHLSETMTEYASAKRRIAARTGTFGIANNHIYHEGGRFVAPYVIADLLVVHGVRDDEVETLASQRLERGKIITDKLCTRLARLSTPRVTDLEGRLFELDAEQAEPIRIRRIRDMAAQLRAINRETNRNRAAYVLRCLVARLAHLSFKSYLEAKNLQSEVQLLNSELATYLNGPRSERFPFLTRILVRNIAFVVSTPHVIDHLWNDTIDLAEVHVRGSAIVNELRRSTHHAIGNRTVQLAQSYLEYLRGDDSTGFEALGVPAPGPVDEAARNNHLVVEIVERVVQNLEQLLGTSDIIGRIDEWRREYERSLLRCEFGKTIESETEEAIAKGVRAASRWTYYHHLRLIRDRIAGFAPDCFDGLPETIETLVSRLEELLELKPDEPGFYAAAAEKALRGVVDGFVGQARKVFCEELFTAVGTVIDLFKSHTFYEAFHSIRDLRRDIWRRIDAKAFPEQRVMLFRLEGLLEEMGYLALRHLDGDFEQNGVRLDQCLKIIFVCIQNATRGGLHSRELRDLAAMLIDPDMSCAEISNALEQIQRNYHKMLRRVLEPFETLQERLGMTSEEVRLVTANLQRYLHDLSSVAHFCDKARAHIRDQVSDPSRRLDGSSPPTPEFTSADIVHLSQLERIHALVADETSGRNLRVRFGSKGSGLIYVSHLNLPTRPGFLIPTLLARSGILKRRPELLRAMIEEHLAILGDGARRLDGQPKRLGDPARPLLVAVRAGSVFSMPGMLATIVFIGMNDAVAESLAADDPWHAYDSYRRFLTSYARGVWGVDVEQLGFVQMMKDRHGVRGKRELPWEAMREIVELTKAALVERGFGEKLEEICREPVLQVLTSVQAVIESWRSPAARRYRQVKGICDSWQTAATVQEMASGNRASPPAEPEMDEDRASLTGVIPRTRLTDYGIRRFTGEFKFSASGDDLVEGTTASSSFRSLEKLPEYMPMLHRRLKHVVAKLRRFMGTDQEIEFTVESGVLSVLQTRTAETAAESEWLSFAEPGPPATSGIGVRGGAFRGLLAFDEEGFKRLSERIEERSDADGVLLVLENPTPHDIPLILCTGGLLTARGGSTSHAAVAINGIEGRLYSAVMSAEGLHVDAAARKALIRSPRNGDETIAVNEGDLVSIDGTTGQVFVGYRDVLSPAE